MIASNSNSWRATKLKFVGRVVGGSTPESGRPEYWDGPVVWLTPVDLGNEGNDAIKTSKRAITEAGAKNAGLELLPVGSVVFSTRAPIGSVGLLACEAVTNQGCKALVPDVRELDSRFCFYLAIDSADKLQSLGLGTTFVELSTYALKNLPALLPTVAEQRRIVTYLDEQTTKIDRLMEMRRRQMDLLKEQRAALIQQAVTRGINPNVEIKYSGLSWLGEIPVNWQVKRFHHVIDFKEGPGIMAVDFHEDGVPLIRISNLRPDGLDWSERTCLDPQLASTKWAHFKVKPGDLLISSSASMGLVSEVDELSTGAIPYTGIIRLRSASAKLTKQFIKLFVGSGLFATQISMFQTGSTIQHFGPLHLRRMVLAVPPLDEQKEIVEYVQRESARHEQLLSAYVRQLEVLTEYRSSLIRECVTGQRSIPGELNA